MDGGSDVADDRLAEERPAKEALAALEDVDPGIESAPANVVVGPVMSLFDRTKDPVRKALADST